MPEKNDLNARTAEAASGISRREAARRLLAGIAAGATSHPIWRHLSDEHLMGHIDAAVPDGKLHFLTREQFESLAATAEAIVPGSNKANVAAFLDLLLSVESEKHQTDFQQSLDAMDAESHNRFGSKFVALGPGQRDEVLTAVSSGPKTDEDQRLLGDAFANLKEWISGAYYSSEIGMRELGWTPERVFAEFPGCTHGTEHG